MDLEVLGVLADPENLETLCHLVGLEGLLVRMALIALVLLWLRSVLEDLVGRGNHEHLCFHPDCGLRWGRQYHSHLDPNTKGHLSPEVQLFQLALVALEDLMVPVDRLPKLLLLPVVLVVLLVREDQR